VAAHSEEKRGEAVQPVRRGLVNEQENTKAPLGSSPPTSASQRLVLARVLIEQGNANRVRASVSPVLHGHPKLERCLRATPNPAQQTPSRLRTGYGLMSTFIDSSPTRRWLGRHGSHRGQWASVSYRPIYAEDRDGEDSGPHQHPGSVAHLCFFLSQGCPHRPACACSNKRTLRAKCLQKYAPSAIPIADTYAPREQNGLHPRRRPHHQGEDAAPTFGRSWDSPWDSSRAAEEPAPRTGSQLHLSEWRGFRTMTHPSGYRPDEAAGQRPA
jgi:hypothetical protein